MWIFQAPAKHYKVSFCKQKNLHSSNKSASQWKDWQILRFLDASCTQMYSQMICSVLNKWQFYFYLSAHSDFGFFSCVGYLHPKLHIKGVKSPFLNFVGYMKHRLLLEGLLNRTKIILKSHNTLLSLVLWINT